MIKKSFICIIMVLSLILNGCTYTSNNEVGNKTNDNKAVSQNSLSNNQENNELIEKLRKSVIDQKYLEEERDYYKATISRLTSKLSEEELLALAKEQWKYKLKVDEQLVEKQSELVINKNSFQVILSEEQAPYQIVPTEIFNKGMISGESYREHIKFINIQPSSVSGRDGTIVTAEIYSFENVPKDTDIKIQLTEELRNRLGINSNMIVISVK